MMTREKAFMKVKKIKNRHHERKYSIRITTPLKNCNKQVIYCTLFHKIATNKQEKSSLQRRFYQQINFSKRLKKKERKKERN